LLLDFKIDKIISFAIRQQRTASEPLAYYKYPRPQRKNFALAKFFSKNPHFFCAAALPPGMASPCERSEHCLAQPPSKPRPLLPLLLFIFGVPRVQQLIEADGRRLLIKVTAPLFAVGHLGLEVLERLHQLSR
jgi:hypothetical protein